MTTAPPPGETLTIVQVASGDLWAGAEVVLYHLSRALHAQSDVRLHVVLLNDGELAARLRDAGVETTVLDETRLGAVTIHRRLHDLLRRLRPDVVHTHRRKENVLGALAAARIGIPSLRTEHGAQEWALGPFQLVRRAYRALDWAAGRFLQARIVAVSDALAEALRGRFPARKVVVVENGIDLEDARIRGGAPVVLPGPEGVARVAFVGRLVPAKRPDLFLEAAARVEGARPGAVRFHVFGDGPLHDEVARRRAVLGLEGTVALEGFVADLPPYLARMDLLLIPSDHEGLPINLLEALALGVPVAAHAVGAIPGVLDQGRAGMLVRDHRPEAYTEAVLACLDDPAGCRARAAAGAARVAAHYTVAAMADRYRAVYEALGPVRGPARAARPAEGSP